MPNDESMSMSGFNPFKRFDVSVSLSLSLSLALSLSLQGLDISWEPTS